MQDERGDLLSMAELDAAHPAEVWSQQSRVGGQNPLPHPAGNTALDPGYRWLSELQMHVTGLR